MMGYFEEKVGREKTKLATNHPEAPEGARERQKIIREINARENEPNLRSSIA